LDIESDAVKAQVERLAASIGAFVVTAREGGLATGYMATGILRRLAHVLYGSSLHMALAVPEYPLRRLLLVGETGTGKEGVAKILGAALMKLRPAPDAKFEPVNCAAFTESLLEGELFGWKRGSHQGAQRERKGVIADLGTGGTLFLDEVGEAGGKMQAGLLRFLQDGSYRPVGADTEVVGELHVIGATNRLEHGAASSVEAGEIFRSDLVYRLAQPTIRLSPLRSITPEGGSWGTSEEKVKQKKVFRNLVEERFKNKASVLPKELVDALNPATVGLLVYKSMNGYHWPGNFRELDSLLAAVLSVSVSSFGTLDKEAVKRVCLEHRRGPRSEARVDVSVPGAAELPPEIAWPVNLRDEADGFERAWYQRAAEEHGQVGRIGRALGVTRQTVARRLQFHGIELEDEG
jgi:transcriptional regulator with GAF, ATPase, and Fis domain